VGDAEPDQRGLLPGERGGGGVQPSRAARVRRREPSDDRAAGGVHTCAEQGLDRRGLLELRSRGHHRPRPPLASSNNGTSFDPPIEVGSGLTTDGAGTWLDAEGIFVGVSASRVTGASASTPGEGVEYATGGIFSYGPEVTRVPGTNKLVTVTNDLDVVKYGVYTGAPLSVTSINDVGNWLIDQTLVSPEGDNSESAVNSGPNGVSMTYRYFVPNDSRVGLRRFDSATNAFGPPTYVEGADTIDNNSLDYRTRSRIRAAGCTSCGARSTTAGGSATA
jgi:hypothetical protein